MKKVLITGAKGQLGSELQEAVKNYPDIEIIATDLDKLDITSQDNITDYIESIGSIDYLVNCAAYTAVDKAEDEQELAKKINAEASLNLAQACKKYDVTLIHVSTDYVFDGTKHRPYTEDDATSPNSVYGDTKLKGEILIEETGGNYLIIRTSWLYSIFGNNFVKTIQRLSNERDELNILFDQIGSPTYARDLAKTILDIIKSTDSSTKIESGIYHYSNEGVCSWYDFAHEIVELSGNTCNLSPIRSEEFPQKANRPSYSVMDKKKIKTNFGIKIPHWRDSLRECINALT